MAEQDPQIGGGAARCPGTSWEDLMAADTMSPPAILTEESYSYLGSEPLDAARYTSEEFAKLDVEASQRYMSRSALITMLINHELRPDVGVVREQFT